MAAPKKLTPITRKTRQGHHHGSKVQCHKKHKPAAKS